MLELASAKSKLLILENHAVAAGLGSKLFLKPLAFSSASVEIVIGPEYFFADAVGDDPSVV